MEPLIISGFLFYDSNMHMGIFSGIMSGFFLGIILAMFFILPDIISQWIWLSLGVFIFSLFLKKITRFQFVLPVVSSLLIGMSIGFWRTNDFHSKYPFDSLNELHNKTIQVTGRVIKPPDITPVRQTLLINPITVDGIPSTNNIIIGIRVSPLTQYQAGDIIRVSGNFTLRTDFESDTGRIVQYRLMSYSKKIFGDISYPSSIRIIGHKKTIHTFFSFLKNKFTESLHAIFMLPASGLLAGMMLGDTSALDNSILDVFRMVGLIHIVVLSGYNINLVTSAFIRIFAFRGYFGRMQFAFIALILFIGIVGISTTALRAGIMTASVFVAKYFLRPHLITRVLLLTLGIMVFISPYSLLFDLSLQLSFLATVGIVYLFPYLQEKFSTISQNTFIEIVLQTIAVNILVMPLILYQIGTLSPVFLPLNVIVLGFIPLLTIGGFLITFLGILFPQLAMILAYPIQLITDSIIGFATWTAKNDPFFTTIPQFSLEILVGIYMLIFTGLAFFLKRSKF